MAVGGRLSTWKHGTIGALLTNTDFTAKTINATPTFDGEEVDSTTWGDSFREFEQTFKNATIAASYKSDDTIFGQIAALYNAGSEISFELGPDGTATGKPKITGLMFLKSFNPSLEIGTLQTLDVSYRVTGAVTFGVFS